MEGRDGSTPDEGGHGGEAVDWSRRPGGGWEEFVRARRRLMQTLASDAERVRLDRLYETPPAEELEEPPDADEGPPSNVPDAFPHR